MLLGLLRDRGAFAMSFAVPAAFFVIFSAVVSGLGGEPPSVSVAVVDEARDGLSAQLLRSLEGDEEILALERVPSGAANLRERVRRGDSDVGLILEPNSSSAPSGKNTGLPRTRIVFDPARDFTAEIVGSRLQQAYLDVATAHSEDGSLPAHASSRAAEESPPSAPTGFAPLVVREPVAGQVEGLGHIAYYAGAAAVLFLLFSTVHGAVSLLEEKESGILERLLVGPGNMAALINGKFLYLVLQGFVQITVIFMVAWVGYGVNLPAHLLPWAVTTLAAAAAAAGLAMALATACSTRQQAQAIANVSILVLSAIGGSMVPRFLMPDWMQELGWLTPNTWALEAYVDIFWREQPMESLLLPWGLLFGAALLGLASARIMARRMESL